MSPAQPRLSTLWIAGGISVVIITAVNLVGTSLDGTFNRVANLFAAP